MSTSTTYTPAASSGVPSVAPSTTSSVPTTSQLIVQPLTTFYSPPAWCKDRLWTSFSTEDGTFMLWQTVSSAALCYPPNFVGELGGVLQIYSPGICPSGWYGATTGQRVSDNRVVQYSRCCPSGFSTVTPWYCGSWATLPTEIAQYSGPNYTITTSALAFEWPIHVEWESSQLNLFTPTSAPLLTAAPAPSITSAPAPSSTSGAPANPGTSSPPGPGGLSTGAKAGIGVGAGLGALIVIALVVVLLMWRKKTSRRKAAERGGGAYAPPPDQQYPERYEQQPQMYQQQQQQHYGHGQQPPAYPHSSRAVSEMVGSPGSHYSEPAKGGYSPAMRSPAAELH